MRVGLFLSDFPIYYLPWACEIVDGLAARGLEINLYLRNAGEKAPVLQNNVNVINLSNPALRFSQKELDYVARQNIPFSHLLSPASIGVTQIISEKKKYDYCIGLESKGLLLAKIAADASGCRLGYLSFELYDEKNPGVWGGQIKDVRKFESLLMPEIDLFMIQDETRHNEYFKILNTNQRPQNTMYFPVSLPRVCLSEKPQYWHRKYNLPQECKIILYIGQICSNRLVDKMVMGAQSFDDDQLLVVHGPAFGNINDILRQLKQLDKKNKVIFSTDDVDCNEMKYLVASADMGLAFYSADRINDFTTGKSSAKLARYMQAGIPVICPAYPTFKDVVDKYHNGECFSDFARLPQLVNRIFENYSYYCKGAKRAFGYIYNLDKYLNVLSKHIKNGNCSNISGTLSVDTTWQQVRQMPVIRLYAGDVPEQKEYEGVIGLSLGRNDQNHLQHDITQPFPLMDNSVDSFQTEDVFEHIPFEKLAPVVNEIYRVLKPGGLFRLSVPDYGCDVLKNRSIKDEKGQIVFDPGGGGTPENPGHVWFPRIDTVMQLLTKTKFHESGRIELLHYYNKDGTFVAKPIDYSKGHVRRTPDFDERVKHPYRPMSLVIDLTKGREMVPQNSVKPAPTQLYKNSQNREEFLPSMKVKNDEKSHYGKEYFDWQKNIGSFGGLANLFKFKEFINITDTVIDFGCGGGYLLRNLQCKEKMGIEVNPHARQEAKRNGIKVVESVDEVPDKFADIIISNHALEHVGNPLEVLKKLRKKLKNNGKIIFVVPHQDTREEYDSADKNKHLYTWNQMTLGNLFSEAGYEVLKAKAFQHQWPPNYIEVCSQYGEEEFHKRCREYAIKNDNYQIRIVAT
jgi:SAM-dependent methyltransferase/glycosyltransferase involved in cell wall biosynthesis